ncbi:helix-turn-helix transcriptional regulator [Mucilaginibacter sp. AW1-7]|uniref:helix-turn-helix transcriptional regulator n=1 Tax=Mucilaginibacter sp. AW1-7 TaxID=3349874 RepID=UPI003F733862
MDRPRLNRLNIVLAELSFSQKDLSTYLGVNLNTISRWCRNIHQPELQMLNQIAKFFQIDILRLIEPSNWENETGPPAYTVYLAQKVKEKKSGKIRQRTTIAPKKGR